MIYERTRGQRRRVRRCFNGAIFSVVPESLILASKRGSYDGAPYREIEWDQIDRDLVCELAISYR